MAHFLSWLFSNVPAFASAPAQPAPNAQGANHPGTANGHTGAQPQFTELSFRRTYIHDYKRELIRDGYLDREKLEMTHRAPGLNGASTLQHSVYETTAKCTSWSQEIPALPARGTPCPPSLAAPAAPQTPEFLDFLDDAMIARHLFGSPRRSVLFSQPVVSRLPSPEIPVLVLGSPITVVPNNTNRIGASAPLVRGNGSTHIAPATSISTAGPSNRTHSAPAYPGDDSDTIIISAPKRKRVLSPDSAARNALRIPSADTRVRRTNRKGKAREINAVKSPSLWADGSDSEATKARLRAQ